MMPGKPRTSGDNTLLDVPIDGKSRRVSVSRKAMEVYLRLSNEQAVEMTAEDRQHFVQFHLSKVVAAAHRKLTATYPLADLIVIAAGEL